MKSAHIDTHDLVVALEAFARIGATGQAGIAAALELANLLMLYERIRFDEAVNAAVRARLDEAIDAVERQHKLDVRSRIVGLKMERHAEDEAVVASVNESFHAIMRRTGNPAYDKVMEVPLKLSGPADPETHLFKRVLSKRGLDDQELAELRRDRSIQGHRFYAAIHRDEDAVRYIRDDPAGARTRLKHVFCLFRMRLSEHRVVYDALENGEHAAAFCYFPLGDRLAIAARVVFENADLGATKVYKDLLKPQLTRIALPYGRELCESVRVFPLPAMVGALVDKSDVSLAAFLESVFAFRTSTRGKRLLRAISDFAEAEDADREEILRHVGAITGQILRRKKVRDKALLHSMFVAAGEGASEAYSEFVTTASPRQALAKGLVKAALKGSAGTGAHLEKFLGRKMLVGSALAEFVAADARVMAKPSRIQDLFRG